MIERALRLLLIISFVPSKTGVIRPGLSKCWNSLYPFHVAITPLFWSRVWIVCSVVTPACPKSRHGNCDGYTYGNQSVSLIESPRHVTFEFACAGAAKIAAAMI